MSTDVIGLMQDGNYGIRHGALHGRARQLMIHRRHVLDGNVGHINAAWESRGKARFTHVAGGE